MFTPADKSEWEALLKPFRLKQWEREQGTGATGKTGAIGNTDGGASNTASSAASNAGGASSCKPGDVEVVAQLALEKGDDEEPLLKKGRKEVSGGAASSSSSAPSPAPDLAALLKQWAP